MEQNKFGRPVWLGLQAGPELEPESETQRFTTESKDRLIFLDIDGVLNCASTRNHFGFEAIDSGCMMDLLRLLKESGASVVISSSWRLDEGWHTVDGFKEKLMHAAIECGVVHGVVAPIVDRIIGLTLSFSNNRAEEIFEWLMANEHVGPFVVLDDDEQLFDAPDIFMERVVFCSDWTGLSGREVERALAVLGK